MSTADIPAYPFRRQVRFDPPDEWAQVRGRGPIVTVRLPSGDEAELVTRFDEARALLGDARFSRYLPPQMAARIAATEDGGIFARQSPTGLSMFEGEGHLRWRRLVSKSFTIRRVEEMRPRIERVADGLVDSMIAAGPPANIVSDLADLLPVQVLGDLLGVPESDRHKFRGWADAILSLTRYTKADADAANAEIVGYFGQLIESKRAEPGSDLLSALLQVRGEDGSGLETAEVVITAAALFIPGVETAANTIGKMMATLLADPGRFRQVVDDPTIVTTAVEEVLRFDTNPSFGLPRFISEDIVLGDQPVPQGTTMIVSPAIANNDPGKFPHPECMDLRRQNNQHVSFGAGPHFCMGAPLARVVLQVVLSTLARRLPSLRLAVKPDELELRLGLIVVGLKEVPVEW
jgi:cytochrome P450